MATVTLVREAPPPPPPPPKVKTVQLDLTVDEVHAVSMMLTQGMARASFRHPSLRPAPMSIYERSAAVRDLLRKALRDINSENNEEDGE